MKLPFKHLICQSNLLATLFAYLFVYFPPERDTFLVLLPDTRRRRRDAGDDGNDDDDDGNDDGGK